MGLSNITRHQQMTTNLIDDFKKRLDNPFYLFNDKKQTPVKYFNINKDQTSLDDFTKVHQSNLGMASPLRFNKIEGAYLYGINRAELSAEFGDWGVEAAEISGEAFVLPETFIPCVNDYFAIEYLDKDILFKVVSVTPDTLPNGANFYKLSYKLDQHGNQEGDIEQLVVGNFVMDVGNFGTDLKIVIKKDENDFSVDVKDLIKRVQCYFTELFYDSAVQTFIFTNNDVKFYDPYMIEFLRRCDILKGDTYIYINHKTMVSKTFNIEYDRTVFKALELRSLEKLENYNNPFVGIGVEEPTSLLSTRYETYYQMTYSKFSQMATVDKFTVFEADPFMHIIENKEYTDEDKFIYNIIIRYFNNSKDLRNGITKIVDNIDYYGSKELFYLLPMIIYILKQEIYNLLKADN